MASDSIRAYSLAPLRTDGWFERVADSIGSFEVLCDVLGEPFVAFSLIAGARVTALTVDRRRPGDTLVDFVLGHDDGEGRPQRLTLDAFREHLVQALTREEPAGPLPADEGDVIGLQRYLGARQLLLAPLFGYGLRELRIGAEGGRIVVEQDGSHSEFLLDDFRQLLTSHVMQEFYRADEAISERRRSLDLTRIPAAREAMNAGRHADVLELLGSWMVPLTLLLRTADGQSLDEATRVKLSEALGLLGGASLALGERQQAYAAHRLSVQYALDTQDAGRAYARLGCALLGEQRFSEAIAALRRGANLGAEPEVVWPALARAFLGSNRLLAALGAVEEGLRLVGPTQSLLEPRAVVFERLAPASAWAALLNEGVPGEG